MHTRLPLPPGKCRIVRNTGRLLHIVGNDDNGIILLKLAHQILDFQRKSDSVPGRLIHRESPVNRQRTRDAGTRVAGSAERFRRSLTHPRAAPRDSFLTIASSSGFP